ncbi:enoyl-CoA hydratase-related protein [Pseudooceanicola aestuarii]|uniref:enoyl-CoA hydratase-related protein n=1 Tax=Pseudooceanicola aestuarii TaxID=2697319 RepID=UPI0013D6EB51|nr:enoyl-CoA hydratase-related protein [Pseudooceanicola aestuarii]
MTENITLTTRDRVTTLTMARPEKRNAITQAMYAAMADALEDYATNDTARAFVITGAAEYFTSGNDVRDFAMGDRSTETPPVLRFLTALSTCPKPVIAAVNGPAIGVGVTMLLHCDLVVIAEEATFSTPFVGLGLVPEAGSSLLLPALIGMALANDMLLANRVLTAAEAHAAGLASRLVPGAELTAETARLAAGVAASAPTAMRETKALIRHGRDQVKAQMDRESVLFSAQLKTPEFAEAVAARMAKRAPVFK